MSTRSVVAYEHDNGEVYGTYVHYDGYPENAIPELTKKFDTIGFDGMKEWIDDGVEGKGYLSYTDAVPFSPKSSIVEVNEHNPWAQEVSDHEYGYLVTKDGVEMIFTVHNDW